jgi:putative membrane protein
MRYHWVGPGEWVLVLGGILLVIALIVLIAWAVTALVRPDRGGGSRGPGSGPPRSTAMEILRERFARGEITEEQFEQARKVLARDG